MAKCTFCENTVARPDAQVRYDHREIPACSGCMRAFEAGAGEGQAEGLEEAVTRLLAEGVTLPDAVLRKLGESLRLLRGVRTARA